MVSDDESGACEFDETPRHLKRGCFMAIDGVGHVPTVQYCRNTLSQRTNRQKSTRQVEKKYYTERESNPCRLLGRQA